VSPTSNTPAGEIKNIYMAIDPGLTSGFAIANGNGQILNLGETRDRKYLLELIGMMDPTVVICESFELFPHKAMEQSWSEMDTVKVIGQIEYWCDQNKKKLVMQRPNTKTMGYRFMGRNKPKGHGSHKVDALSHLIYWLQVNQIRQPQQPLEVKI
jgi:hypothetical protein